jgi:ADP-heptose:LPS heptosyltransferase
LLLISSGGLGDTVLFCHVIDRFSALAQNGEKVEVLLRSDSIKMGFLIPANISIISIDFKRMLFDMAYRYKVTNSLFNANYRLVIHTDYLRHPDLDEVLCAATHAMETVAMEPRSWLKYNNRLNYNRIIYSRLFDSGSEIQDKIIRWSRFANWLTGIELPLPSVVFEPSRLASAIKVYDPVVIIQPFSAVKKKQIPSSHYRHIIENLSSETRVIITGAPGDLDENSDFKSLLKIKGVEFNNSKFEDLVPLLRAAKLVISVDTAIMHLAVSVGAPTICIASAAYVGEIVPYYKSISPKNARFIYHTMDCEGCLGKCIHPLENGMYPCIALHKEDQILAIVSEFVPVLEKRNL